MTEGVHVADMFNQSCVYCIMTVDMHVVGSSSLVVHHRMTAGRMSRVL